jgi:outer membrane protein OmpU
MKKVLLATTALALSAGVAYAEVSLSGSAVLGLKYNGGAGAGNSKTTEHSEVSLSFGGSVETDGGLSFSASTTLLNSNNGTTANDGTTVSVSGAFGTLSMGSVTAADRQGGLADIGLKGIGIDDVAEKLDGPTGHDVGFTYSTGALSFSVSAAVGGATAAKAGVAGSCVVAAGTSVVAVAANATCAPGDTRISGADAVAAAKNESYAVGAKYTFGSSYVGVGMNSTNAVTGVTTASDGDTTSIYAGTSMDAFSVNAMYSSFDSEVAGAAKKTAQGINVAYTTGATTISFGYADDNTAGSKAVYGAGVSYDLGAGAAIKAGVGKVRDAQSAAATVTKADLGVSFSF